MPLYTSHLFSSSLVLCSLSLYYLATSPSISLFPSLLSPFSLALHSLCHLSLSTPLSPPLSFSYSFSLSVLSGCTKASSPGGCLYACGSQTDDLSSSWFKLETLVLVRFKGPDTDTQMHVHTHIYTFVSPDKIYIIDLQCDVMISLSAMPSVLLGYTKP